MPKIADKQFYEDHAAAVLLAIDNRIEMCKKGVKQGNEKDESWHLVVEHAKADDDISDMQKEKIRYMCRYMFIALNKARNEMGNLESRPLWSECAAYAVELMAKSGQNYITSPRTLQNGTFAFGTMEIAFHIQTLSLLLGRNLILSSLSKIQQRNIPFWHMQMIWQIRVYSQARQCLNMSMAFSSASVMILLMKKLCYNTMESFLVVSLIVLPNVLQKLREME